MSSYECISLYISAATLGVYVVGAGIASWAAISAFKTLKAQRESIRLQDEQFRKESANYQKEKLTGEAIQCLERAFSNLIAEGQATPSNERIKWLAAARQIQSYLTLKDMISAIDPAPNDPHIVICESNEAHWSHVFYQAIPDDFFDNQVLISLITDQRAMIGRHERASLEPLSVLSVLAFMSINSKKIDPVETVNIDASIESIGLRFPRLRQQFRDRRQSLINLVRSYSANQPPNE